MRAPPPGSGGGGEIMNAAQARPAVVLDPFSVEPVVTYATRIVRAPPPGSGGGDEIMNTSRGCHVKVGPSDPVDLRRYVGGSLLRTTGGEDAPSPSLRHTPRLVCAWSPSPTGATFTGAPRSVGGRAIADGEARTSARSSSRVVSRRWGAQWVTGL